MSCNPHSVTRRNDSKMMPRFIFESPSDAVGERDRDLDHAETGSHHPIRHLHLEHVAARLHTVETDRAEGIGAVDPVPGGGVVDRESEHDRHVPVAPA